MLRHLDLKGALVTMETMGPRRTLPRAIRDGRVDYCMSLKNNWPAVHDDVERLSSDPPSDVTFETKQTLDLTRERIETRRVRQIF